MATSSGGEHVSSLDYDAIDRILSVKILTLGTANVARSAMLAYMLTTIGEGEGRDWRVRSAGTHALDNLPMDRRALAALESVGELGEHRYGAHRSHLITTSDLADADVVLAMEAAQVRHVGSLDETLAARTVHFSSFVRSAALDEPLAAQMKAVRVLGLDDALDVAEHAHGDEVTYERCARELWELAQAFAVVVL